MSQIVTLFAGLDGTGNHRVNDTNLKDGSRTNIAKLHKLYESAYGKNALYQEGVGTVTLTENQVAQVRNGLAYKTDFYDKYEMGLARDLGDFDGLVPANAVGRQAENMLEQIERRMLEIQNSDPDALIHLDVAGFSRGAAAARHLVNLLNETYGEEISEGRLVINTVVLFDTVGSVDFANSINFGLNLDLGEHSANHIVQYTAKDEKRSNFPLESLKDEVGNLPENFSEIVLHGVHSDIGGGYETEVSEGTIVDSGSIGSAEEETELQAMGYRVELGDWDPASGMTPYTLLEERTVTNDLSNVALAAAYGQLVKNGATLPPLRELGDEASVPPELEGYLQAVLRGEDLRSYREVVEDYIHRSDIGWESADKPPGDLVTHFPDFDGERDIYYNEPENAVVPTGTSLFETPELHDNPFVSTDPEALDGSLDIEAPDVDWHSPDLSTARLGSFDWDSFAGKGLADLDWGELGGGGPGAEFGELPDLSGYSSLWDKARDFIDAKKSSDPERIAETGIALTRGMAELAGAEISTLKAIERLTAPTKDLLTLAEAIDSGDADKIAESIQGLAGYLQGEKAISEQTAERISHSARPIGQGFALQQALEEGSTLAHLNAGLALTRSLLELAHDEEGSATTVDSNLLSLPVREVIALAHAAEGGQTDKLLEAVDGLTDSLVKHELIEKTTADLLDKSTGYLGQALALQQAVETDNPLLQVKAGVDLGGHLSEWNIIDSKALPEGLTGYAGALGAAAAFQAALEGGDSKAVVTATTKLLEQLDALDIEAIDSLFDSDLLSVSESNGSFGATMGVVGGAFSFSQALESGDTAGIIRSGAELGSQVAKLAAETATSSAAAQSLNTVAKGLGQVAGAVGFVMALQAGDGIGAFANALMMSGNPYAMAVGFVISVANSLFGGDEPPPPTAHSYWEYDFEKGGFSEYDADSKDGGNLGALRDIAEGIDGTLAQLIVTSGGALIPPEGLTLDVAQSDDKLFVNGRRYAFDDAGEAIIKAAIDMFRERMSIEGGDPLLRRALYESNADTQEELQQDLQVAQGYRQYTEGQILLDADGRPLTEAGSARYKEDLAALQAGEISAEAFHSLYRLADQKTYVDGLFAALPGGSESLILLADKQADLGRLDYLGRGIESEEANRDWLRQALEDVRILGEDSDPEEAQEKKHDIEFWRLHGLGLSGEEFARLEAGKHDSALLEKLEQAILARLEEIQTRLNDMRSELAQTRERLTETEQALADTQPQAYLNQLAEREALQKRIAEGEKEIADVSARLAKQQADLKETQATLSDLEGEAKADAEAERDALVAAIDATEVQLEDLNQQQAARQAAISSLSAAIEEAEQSWPTLKEAADWFGVFERSHDLRFDEPHWTDNTTRLNTLIDQTDSFDLTRVALSDLTLELKEGALILRSPLANGEGTQELIVNDWARWDKANSHLHLQDGSHINVQGLIETYGVADGDGPVHLGEAALALFQAVEGIEAAELGGARAGSEGDDILQAHYRQVWLDGRGGDDTLQGTANDDYLRGGGGADSLIGSLGSDTALYDESTEGVYVDLDRDVGRGGSAAGDTFESIENLLGSRHDDLLVGDVASNRLAGGEGDDLLAGAAGDDTLEGGSGDDVLRGGDGGDRLIGGAGTDTADYQDADQAVSVELDRGDDISAVGGAAEGDSFESIENLTGSGHADSLSGDQYANALDGGEGDDRLSGLKGDDSLLGGGGRDLLLGGDGDDSLDGGAGDDALVAGAGDDLLVGGSGDDLLIGGEGEDTALFEDAIDDYDLYLQNDALVVASRESGDRDALLGIEKVGFSAELYDVQSLMELLRAPPTVAENGEVVEQRERERDSVSQAAAIALASVYGTAAALYTEESSAEEITWFDDDPSATQFLTTEGGETTESSPIEDAPIAAELMQSTEVEGTVSKEDSAPTGSDDGAVPPSSADGSDVFESGPAAPAPEPTPVVAPMPAQNERNEGEVNDADSTETVESLPASSEEQDSEEPLPPLSPPAVEAVAVTTLEDESVLLDIQVDHTSTDGLVVVVSGIPEGASLSSGTNLGGGSWQVTDLEGLRFIPAPHSDVDVNLTITAIVTDRYGRTVGTTLEQEVTIVAVSDAAELSAADAAGSEDTAIALDIHVSFADQDGSEIHRIEVAGVPEGARLSAGSRDTAGTWHLSPDQLNGLTLTPALHDDADFTLRVSAFAEERENGDTAITTRDIDVHVKAVADAPEMTVVDTIALEDDISPVEIYPHLIDADGSETLSVLVEGVPPGATLSHGVELEPGIWRLTPEECTEVVITPPANSDIDFQLRVTATTTEGANGDQAHTVRLLNVELTGVADGAIVTAEAATGKQNQFIPLSVDAELIDTDGSESLVFEIRDVPNGALLSAGTDLGGGVWRLEPGQLEGLELLPPLDSHGDFRLTVAALATEQQTGEVRASYASLDVTVAPVPTTPGLSVQPISGAEDSAIPLDISVDLSNLKPDERLSVEIGGLPAGATLSAGESVDGVWILTPEQLSGLTLTPPPDSDADFTLEVAAVTRIVASDGVGARVAANVPVRVEAAADDVDFSIADVRGDEDTLIPLAIAGQLRDVDGSELFSVTIEGVPEGATLSAGKAIAPGIWRVDADQLTGLALKPPPDYSGSFKLSATAISQEQANGDSAQQTLSFTVLVDGIADLPGLQAAADAAVAGEPVGLHISGWLGDSDGSEHLIFEVSGLPNGATLSAGQESNGTWTLTAAELQGLTLIPPGGPAKDFSVTVKARAVEAGSETTVERSVDVRFADAGAPALSLQVLDAFSPTAANGIIDGVASGEFLFGGRGGDVLRGLGGNDRLHGDTSGASATVALAFDAALATTDGSEELRVIIERLPVGATLSAGTPAVDGGGQPIPGSWVLRSEDLDGLILQTPADGEPLDLSVSAVAVEIATGQTRVASASLAITLPDTADSDSLLGGEGGDLLFGEGGNDLLKGDSGNDYLDAGMGDDHLVGGVGADVLFGGEGDDVLVVDADDDNLDIDGGAGNDTVIVDDDRGVTFAAGVSAVENITGGRGDDVLIGDGGANVLRGGQGRDTLLGGDGDDLMYADAEDIAGGSAFVDGGSGFDTLTFETSASVRFDATGRSLEKILGGLGDDHILYSGSQALHVESGAGDDRLESGSGADILDGGEGNDTADYRRSGAAVTVNLSNGQVRGGAAHGDTLLSIENIVGSDFGDTLTGDHGDNIFTGGNGDDVIDGGAGNDTARFSGAFRDYYDGDTIRNIQVNGLSTATVSGVEGTDSLTDIEQLAFADNRTIYLDGRNNRPDAVDDTITIREDSAVTVDVTDLLANDFDFDGDAFQLVSVSGAKNGSVRLNEDGTIRFTPDADYNSSTNNRFDMNSALFKGEAGFQYTIEDQRGAQHTAWVGIDVNAVNDAPSLRISQPFYRSGIVTGRGKVEAFDPDSDPSELVFRASSLEIYKSLTATTFWYVGETASGEPLRHTGNWTFRLIEQIENSVDPENSWTKYIYEGQLSAVGSVHGGGVVEGNSAEYSYFYNGYRSPVQGRLYNHEEMRPFVLTVTDADGASDALVTGQYYSRMWRDPLVLDLDGDGIELVDSDAGVTPDLNGDSVADATGWVAADDALLVYDIGRDRLIDRPEELLFAEFAPEAENDLEALRIAFDTDANGRFDSDDAAWQDFALWQDSNQNAVTDEGELTYLTESSISHFDLNGVATHIDVGGNRIVEMANYTTHSGATHVAAAVYLATEFDEPLGAETAIQPDTEEPSIDQQLANLLSMLAAEGLAPDYPNPTSSDLSAAENAATVAWEEEVHG